MKITILLALVLLSNLAAFAQPPRPKAVSDYSKSAIRLRWSPSKNIKVKEYIRRNVSSMAVEDEQLNELAKVALFNYITKNSRRSIQLPTQKSPKHYIPDSLSFELNTLDAERNYYLGYLNLLGSYKKHHYSISSTSLQYQGYYVERYGSVWFDVYDPYAGEFKGIFLVIVKLYYDDGFKVWTQNADVDIW